MPFYGAVPGMQSAPNQLPPMAGLDDMMGGMPMGQMGPPSPLGMMGGGGMPGQPNPLALDQAGLSSMGPMGGFGPNSMQWPQALGGAGPVPGYQSQSPLQAALLRGAMKKDR